MFKNMSIKSKLSWLVFIPIFALFIISMKILYTDYNKVEQLEKLKVGVELATKISKLLHETQKERGMTAGYISSNGKNFSDKLPIQRELTTKQIGILKQFINNNNIENISKDLDSVLNDALNDLANISTIREKITNLSIKPSDAINYYTNVNAKLLNGIVEISKISESPLVTKQLVAFANFLNAKERAGIERAIGAATLSRDAFVGESRIKFNNLIASQNSFIKNFLQYATHSSAEYYRKAIDQQSVKEVDRIRDILLNAKEIGGFNVDSTYWFDTISKKITLLKQTEDFIVKNLRISNLNLKREVKIAVAGSNLLHETQKERGATAGYIGSGGKKFKNKLAAQRLNTNKKYKNFLFVVKQNRYSLSARTKKYLDKVLVELNRLEQIRSKVSSLTISASDAIGYYTNLNSLILDMIGTIVKDSTTKNEAEDLNSYYNFLMAKERAGIERAVLANSFARNKFLPGMKDKFIKLMTEQNSFLKSFSIGADKKVLEFYNTKMKDRSVAEVQKMRAIAKNSEKIGGFETDPAYWFSTISKKINILKDVDDHLSNELIKTITDELNSINRGFYIILAIVILSFVMSLVIALNIMNNLLLSIKTFQTNLLHFFEYVNRKRDSLDEFNIISNDEIGQMTQIVNENIKQTAKFIEQDKHVLEEIDDVIEKVNNGFFQYTVENKTSNPQVEELKNKINFMIVSIRDNFKILNEALMQFGHSNFDYKIPSDHTLKGSFGTLSLSTKLLGDNVSEMLAMIKQSGDILNDDTKMLAISSKSLSKASNQQAANLEETAAALEEITSSMRYSRENAISMAEYAKTLTKDVDSGKELAKKTTESMELINNQVSKINDAIAVIDQIAFQTNILSLNAAVEAATAGEAGKGFAVVAQEVRNLASRSADAAKEIKDIVEQATLSANTGKEVTEAMSQGYESLNQSIVQTIELINGVAASSKEQELGITQINDSVSSLDQATQLNAVEAANINQLAAKVATLSKKLTSVSSYTKFDPNAMGQICDSELLGTVAKLKNDHITYKEVNYSKLASKTVWSTTKANECDLGKWIRESEKDQKPYTKTKNWEELKEDHDSVHRNIQAYIEQNAKGSSNELLNRISVDIEKGIINVFEALNTVKMENCGGKSVKKREKFRKKTIDLNYKGPDRRAIEKNIKKHNNVFVPDELNIPDVWNEN